MTLGITMICHYAECRVLINIMLSVILLNVVLHSVILLSVIMLIVVAQSDLLATT